MQKQGIFIIYLFILSLALNCATTQQGGEITKRRNDQPLTQGDEVYQEGVILEDFDPLSLDDEDIDFQNLQLDKKENQDTGPVESGISPSYLSIDATSESSADTSMFFSGKTMIPGFRVQVCASRTEATARNLFSRAQNLFAKYEFFKVYLEYDSPYYKVRIGDFKTRYDADRLLRFAIANNFHDAWIVKTNVYEQDELINYEEILEEMRIRTEMEQQEP